MKKLTLSMLALAIACCLSMGALAQNDSSWLDAGTLKLKREFTQTISIKGEDLERMPFANLGEAIGAWLYGVYSNEFTLNFVVDGIPVADVNGYSIYDIEEIVFVQNALAKVNGASGQGQMVLIKTKKKGTGPVGVTVVAQSALVRQDFGEFYPGSSIRSNTDVYDQFYAGLNRSENNMDFGLSADYLRDVSPCAKADSIQSNSPYVLSRLRLNGYLDLKLGKRNDIKLHVNYTPQTMDSAQHYYANSFLINGNNDYPVPTYQDTHQQQQSFSPWLSWHSELSKRWENEAQVAWLSYTNRVNGEENATDTIIQPSANYMSMGTGYQRSEHLFARERLSYTIRSGGWNIAPSLNASYEHITDGVSNTGGGYPGGGGLYSVSGTQYFLSPSVDIGYKHVFDAQGGLLANLSSQHFSNGSIDRSFPFASLTADLLRWYAGDSRSSLKLFASYAKMTDLANDDYSLPDLSYMPLISTPLFGIGPGGPFFGSGIPGATLAGVAAVTLAPRYSSSDWEVGTVFSTADGRVQINYHFEKNSFVTRPFSQGFGPRGGFGQGTGYFEVPAASHYLGMIFKVLQGEKGAIDWQSGLNISTIHLNIENFYYVYLSPYLATGDLDGNSNSWTGGWTNRLRYMNFSMGLNFLYRFGEASTKNYFAYNPGPTPPAVNSIVLQNIYLAYRPGLSGGHNVELYLDCRNLFQNSSSDVTDGRRYYGVGGKMSL